MSARIRRTKLLHCEKNRFSRFSRYVGDDQRKPCRHCVTSVSVQLMLYDFLRLSLRQLQNCRKEHAREFCAFSSKMMRYQSGKLHKCKPNITVKLVCACIAEKTAWMPQKYQKLCFRRCWFFSHRKAQSTKARQYAMGYYVCERTIQYTWLSSCRAHTNHDGPEQWKTWIPGKQQTIANKTRQYAMGLCTPVLTPIGFGHMNSTASTNCDGVRGRLRSWTQNFPLDFLSGAESVQDQTL